MQSLRFQSLNIFILQKSVQFCGKTIAKSKKRVKWVISQDDILHQIYCSISFKSGKKKVIHNGHIIIDLVNPKQFIDAIISLGSQRMILMVDVDRQDAKIQRKYQQKNDQFLKFKNQYSGPVVKVFEKQYSLE